MADAAAASAGGAAAAGAGAAASGGGFVNGMKSAAASVKHFFVGTPLRRAWLFYVSLILLAFVLVSPGIIATLPPTKDAAGATHVWFSGTTWIVAALVSALLFFGLLVGIVKLGSAYGIAIPFL